MFPLSYDNEALLEQARCLASFYGFDLNPLAKTRLQLTEQGLTLIAEPFSPLRADFSESAWKKRHQAGKQQALVQACRPVPGLRIVDATAGWGRDASVLASFGAEVLMLERQAPMAALLQDALDRLPDDAVLKSRLSLQHLDAKAYLQALPEDLYPDLIFLDPMHPLRQKSALVKKHLQILQSLIGPDEDALELLELALQRARHRVVVKWPLRAPALRPPDQSVRSKTLRFDGYIAINKTR